MFVTLRWSVADLEVLDFPAHVSEVLVLLAATSPWLSHTGFYLTEVQGHNVMEVEQLHAIIIVIIIPAHNNKPAVVQTCIFVYSVMQMNILGSFYTWVIIQSWFRRIWDIPGSFDTVQESCCIPIPVTGWAAKFPHLHIPLIVFLGTSQV